MNLVWVRDMTQCFDWCDVRVPNPHFSCREPLTEFFKRDLFTSCPSTRVQTVFILIYMTVYKLVDSKINFAVKFCFHLTTTSYIYYMVTHHALLRVCVYSALVQNKNIKRAASIDNYVLVQTQISIDWDQLFQGAYWIKNLLSAFEILSTFFFRPEMLMNWQSGSCSPHLAVTAEYCRFKSFYRHSLQFFIVSTNLQSCISNSINSLSTFLLHTSALPAMNGLVWSVLVSSYSAIPPTSPNNLQHFSCFFTNLSFCSASLFNSTCFSCNSNSCNWPNGNCREHV